VPHAAAGNYRFFASETVNGDQVSGTISAVGQLIDLMSLPIVSSSPALEPWETLEQPSMAFAFGPSPGSITLNHWVSLSSTIRVGIRVESDAQPRSMPLLSILERLRKLEQGLETDSVKRYKSLYGLILRDSDRSTDPHLGMERQITDLITVLSRSDWIDFSKLENQIVAGYLLSDDQARHQKFFLQLLLSIELFLRIDHRDHSDWAKRKLMPQLPPTLSWDLALAQRWVRNISIERPKKTSKQSSINFNLRNKATQIELLRDFAWRLKWPNMSEVEDALDEVDSDEISLEERSIASMSWYTGVILPGKTVPWLIMKALIDCDPDAEAALRGFSHLDSNVGIQHRANTYWPVECVVGKVLGAASGVQQVAGWIGPCHCSTDLRRTEVIKVYQLPSTPSLSKEEVENISRRSSPRGQSSRIYSYEDYKIVRPEQVEDTDAVRIERLAFVKVDPIEAGTRKASLRSAARPELYEASIIFAIKGQSRPLSLLYDVSFISTSPCSQGPHVLCSDYTYEFVPVNGLLYMDGLEARGRALVKTSEGNRGTKPSTSDVRGEEFERVLVIEAYGVPDNEVLGRAWCAHWGLSAVVSDISRTCIACSIRKAYAACLKVLILSNGQRNTGTEGVDSGNVE
jgi:hypothetical protein